MDNLIQVDGHPGLARDKKTGALININKRSIFDARNAKAQRIKERNRLDNIESQMTEVLNILRDIVEKNG